MNAFADFRRLRPGDGRRGNPAQKAKELARWRMVQRVSSNGGTRADVCSETGLSEAGLQSMIYRRTGSTRWPIGIGSTDI